MQDYTQAPAAAGSPLKLRKADEVAREAEPHVHVIRPGVRCETEPRGFATPHGRSPLEIVVDASQGFIPLWAKGSTLRWRFREASLQSFEDPDDVKARVEQLLAEALLLWGDAVPVRFSKQDDPWDFEIVVREEDSCSPFGCTLARAFFPDPGRHDLALYPRMFTQSRKEQVDTMAHEIGHIFGLRHFFAKVSETTWPAHVFGKHDKFSIMNYGADSEISDYDRADLKALYQAVWAGELTQINGTPIKLVKPFHTLAEPMGLVAVAPMAAAVAHG
jgi:Metallo-peptidase family M12B Reprolysin-like